MIRVGFLLVNTEVADLPGWTANVAMPQCPSIGAAVVIEGREVRVLSEMWKLGTAEGDIDVILRVRVEGQK
jgi:hypothetical protein